MKRKLVAISTSALFALTVLSAGLMTTNCALLSEVMNIIGMQLLGINPANNFGSTGNIEFSLMGQSQDSSPTLASLASSGLNVRVQNEDGSYSECDFVEEQVRAGSEFNTLAIVIDDSGSMERAYPMEEYGDLCLTCPHDPSRIRSRAAEKLFNRVLEEAPTSRIALMDFGPAPTPGMQATRILADFTDDLSLLESASSRIDGSQMVGTPMWDSLAEIITMTADEAEEYHEVLMSRGLNSPTRGEPGTLERPDREAAEEEEPVVDSSSGEIRVQRYMVVLGDGDDDPLYGGSVNFSLEDVIALAIEHNVVIHAIGLGPAAATNDNPLVKREELVATVTNLQRLAEATGGYYASAARAEELMELYEAIALSMTEGYSVNTFACTPREKQEDERGSIPRRGESVNGTLSLGRVQIPWRTIAP